jgi:hypothetical protein
MKPAKICGQIVTLQAPVLELASMFNPLHYRPLESRANLFAD